MAELLFWPALAVAVWAYVGYPMLSITLAQTVGTEPKRASITPPVNVVVAVRNESTNIAARIVNILSADYPADRLGVRVIDDGSDDDSAEQALSTGDPRVQVIRLGSHAGKAVALNRAIEQVDTPVTIFCDARQRFAPETIAELVAPFADPEIGAVSGVLVFSNESSHITNGAGTYWQLERKLRVAEARLGQAHAVTGAVYAIRTQLFRSIPPGLLLDDMFVPLSIVKQGYRIWVEPKAIAQENLPSDSRHEFWRKLRTLTGNWQLIELLPWLLSPRSNPVFFAWISHKFMRLLAPWAILTTLLAAAIGDSLLFASAFWTQVIAYLFGLGVLTFPRYLRRLPFSGPAGTFVLLNAAALVSFPVWLFNRNPMKLWKR